MTSPAARSTGIFSSNFVEQPYWWDAWDPRNEPAQARPPARADVVIVGGGYSGLNAALTLSRHGIRAVVLEKDHLGIGASSRNGGGVSGGVNLGKTLSGRRIDYAPGQKERILREAAQAYTYVEDLIKTGGIACHWQNHGRFAGAWTPEHYVKQEASIAALNDYAMSGAYMVPREAQRAEIGSDVYYGGLVISRSSTLHPALYYKGLLDACRAAGVTLCPGSEVVRMAGRKGAWRLTIADGTQIAADQVLVATNGYTGTVTSTLHRRVIPIASNIIVTEPLPEGMAQALLPSKRMINDTPRIRSYYRLTPDGTRMLFGGRGKFAQGSTHENAQAVYDMMLARLPTMKGVKIDYAWAGNVAFTFDGTPHFGELEGLHYVLGCNGSGVAMMSYLGHMAGLKIAGAQPPSAFETEPPGNALYTGNTWFLPVIGGYFKFLDRIERGRAERR